MPTYTVNISENAEEDLTHYRAYERRIILTAASTQLSEQPQVETKERKKLRDNAVAPWEVRIGTYRVFYTVEAEDETVTIVSVGHKEHNVLFIRGRVVKL